MSKRTKTTALALPERAKQALATVHTEEQLRGLAQASASITEITNDDGRAQVHQARMLLKNTRCTIQKVGKEARDDAQKFGKAVIAEENRLIAIIEPEEGRLERLQEEWDAAREREKQAAIDAEIKRVDDIRARIAELHGNQSLSDRTDPALIAEHIGDVERMQIDGSFDEFADEASAAKAVGLERLRALHAAAVTYQAEQEQIRKDREELERLRTEKAERDRMHDEQLAAAKRADEAAAPPAPEFQPSAPTVAATHKPAKPPDRDMLQVLATHYGVSPELIVDWILAMDLSFGEEAA